MSEFVAGVFCLVIAAQLILLPLALLIVLYLRITQPEKFRKRGRNITEVEGTFWFWLPWFL